MNDSFVFHYSRYSVRRAVLRSLEELGSCQRFQNRYYEDVVNMTAAARVFHIIFFYFIIMSEKKNRLKKKFGKHNSTFSSTEVVGTIVRYSIFRGVCGMHKTMSVMITLLFYLSSRIRYLLSNKFGDLVRSFFSTKIFNINDFSTQEKVWETQFHFFVERGG